MTHFKHQPFTRLHSTEDDSVNFIKKMGDDESFIEARYVRRADDYFVIYLSSHRGCDKACRFCHLTATGQTDMTEVSIEDFYNQAEVVMGHYAHITHNVPGSRPAANRVNFNWMARGEPLANSNIKFRMRKVWEPLEDLAQRYNLTADCNISTIMPSELEKENLYILFKDVPVSFFYSLYSMRPEFRRRWLPKAMDPEKALDLLADWQVLSGQNVVIHWAYIEGENDTEEDAYLIKQAIESRGMDCCFYVVRYNPFSPKQGKESSPDKIQKLFDILQPSMKIPGSRIVQRVGFDVKASCGMFLQGIP